MTNMQVEFPTHERPHSNIGTPQMLLIATGFTVLFFVALYFTPVTDGNFMRDLFLGAERKGGKLIKPFLVERVIFQGVTTWVWALSTATIILKLLRTRAERQSLHGDIIPEDIDFRNTEQCVVVYERIKNHPQLTQSVGLTRVARVMAMWINTVDFERVAQYAREQADLDAAVSDSSYRRNRLFIWAMPLLGFVGTVFGVAAGISGFAAFLSGSNVTPEEIKNQVGSITEGLAVAFYCTLLGLVTAGLAAFPSLMAERKEEDALSEVEEYVQDRMVSKMPSGQGEQQRMAEELANAVRQGMEGATLQQKFPIEELAQAIDAGFRRLPNPDRYEEVFSHAVAKAGDIINQKYDQFAQNYEKRVSELGAQLGGKIEQAGIAVSTSAQQLAQQVTVQTQQVLQQMTEQTQRVGQQMGEQTERVSQQMTEQSQRVGQQMVEQTQRLAQSLAEMETRQNRQSQVVTDELKRLATQMPEEFRKAQERYLGTQAEAEQRSADRFEKLTEHMVSIGRDHARQFSEAHDRYVAAIADLDAKEIARWEKMVAEFNQLAGRLAEQFKQSVASLDSTTARYSERVQESAAALSEQLRQVQALGMEIDKVLRTTQSMEATLRQVGSSDEFRQTLNNLRTHLTASDELLRQLSRPRRVVFQEMHEG